MDWLKADVRKYKQMKQQKIGMEESQRISNDALTLDMIYTKLEEAISDLYQEESGLKCDCKQLNSQAMRVEVKSSLEEFYIMYELNESTGTIIITSNRFLIGERRVIVMGTDGSNLIPLKTVKVKDFDVAKMESTLKEFFDKILK